MERVTTQEFFKVRIRFEKRGESRFLSHHDLMRLFERVIRRAGIPVRMSRGFNPRPKISLSLALAVGIESTDEIAEIELKQWVAAEDLQRRFNEQLPGGLSVLSVHLIPPSETAAISDVAYEVRWQKSAPIGQDDIDRVLSASEIIVQRKQKDTSKAVDIRPFIKNIRYTPDSLVMCLTITPRGTAKPIEVLNTIGVPDAATFSGFSIMRTSINLAAAKSSPRAVKHRRSRR